MAPSDEAPTTRSSWSDVPFDSHGPGAHGAQRPRKRYSLIQRVEQFTAVYLWLGWISTYLIVIVLLAMGPPQLRYGLLGLLAMALLTPAGDATKPPGKLMRTFGSWAMHRAAEYFNLRVDMPRATTAALAKAKAERRAVVYGLEPHDVLPYSIFFASGYLGYMPCNEARGLMSNACFWLPLMKHVYTAVSGAPVLKENLLNMLDRGFTVALIPGGVQEVGYLTKCKEKEIIIFLENRKGFIKYAITKGALIIPAFAFGLHTAYRWWSPRGRISLAISRFIGFVPLVFFGSWNIPYGPPKRCDLTVVAGEPLQVPATLTDASTPEEIDACVTAVHRQYIDKTVEIFQRHQDEAGMAGWTLTVV